MAEPAAAKRVRRYRAAQRDHRGMVRVGLQVPKSDLADIKAAAKQARDRHARACLAKRELEFVLSTLNAPRPRHLDAPGLLHCLSTSHPAPAWFPHIEALSDEVSIEAIHDLVLANVVDFEQLYRASRTWRVTHGRNVPWIKEMADLSLARPADFDDPTP